MISVIDANGRKRIITTFVGGSGSLSAASIIALPVATVLTPLVDILPIVHDPSGSPILEKLTIQQLGAAYFGYTAPDNSIFSWVNQGGASVTPIVSKEIYLEAPIGSLGATNWRIRDTAIPATPYILDICMIPNVICKNYQLVGIVLRDSVSGKLITHAIEIGNSNTNECYYAVQKWNSPTSFNASYIETLWAQGYGLVWLRVTDDGTTRKFFVSKDGEHFQQVASNGHTDFLTANRIGFAATENTGTFPAGMNLISWQLH